MATRTETAALRDAIAAARGAKAAGHAAFAAAVVVGDEVVAWGLNEVHRHGDPSRHAEVVALAAAKAVRRDLTAASLVSTMQPCEMCLAAMRWAGVSRLVFAVRQDSVGEGFFQFGGLSLADFHRAASGSFEHLGGHLEGEALDLYA